MVRSSRRGWRSAAEAFAGLRTLRGLEPPLASPAAAQGGSQAALSLSGCLRQHHRLLLSWELRGAEFAASDHLASPVLGGGCCVSSGKVWAGFHRLFDFK